MWCRRVVLNGSRVRIGGNLRVRGGGFSRRGVVTRYFPDKDTIDEGAYICDRGWSRGGAIGGDRERYRRYTS